ncbi:MAG: transcription antitermination factor NusB [Phycisphaerales bacterium]|jgi:N utilization substance protein B|nr:transcription antitermination factor NusB [Phycisphaerales bacterium]
MNDHHVIRRGALLALCQFDAGREGDPDLVRDGLLGGGIDERLADAAMALAAESWAAREDMDALIAPLTADWPRHRQPLVDRCVLRLAAFEITSGRVPPKVAITEAIELVREFSTADSPRFVNGVLDRLWHDAAEAQPDETSTTTGEPS